jgi:hypothetical protein
MKILWRNHDTNTRRVWRDDWPFDVFEIIQISDFDKVEWFCSHFAIPLIEANEDD